MSAIGLQPLRGRLRQLQNRRAGNRTGLGMARWLLAAGLLLLGLFLFDWILQPPWLLRCVYPLGLIAGLGLAWRKLCQPLLAIREDETALALLVERRHQIDSDLVAALQFQQAESSAWGSKPLREAVMEYVAEFSQSLDIFAGDSSAKTWKLVGLAALLWASLSGLGLCFPDHLRAFGNRLLFGAARYPSRTTITQITVNDQPVSFENSSSTPRVRLPFGVPLKFAVQARGQLPKEGHLRLVGRAQGTVSQLELKSSTPDQQSGDGLFLGEFSRMGESVFCNLTLGDTWSDRWEIEIVPLPLVELELPVTPPEYAASTAGNESSSSTRLISVLEGSSIHPKLSCLNKPLKSAWIKIDDERFPLERMTTSGSANSKTPAGVDQWTGSPAVWNSIRQAHKFEVQVEDHDGMSLIVPLSGSVRMKTDRVPRVAAAIVSRHVLPTASPKITYGAVDDFGISRLQVTIQIVRESAPPVVHVRDLPALPKPEPVVRGEYAVPLSEFPLEKGDEVRLTLTAWDFRGRLEPQSGTSEPLLLQVTDRNGILAGLLETDQQSAKQLDSIIQRELGIGGEK